MNCVHGVKMGEKCFACEAENPQRIENRIAAKHHENEAEPRPLMTRYGAQVIELRQDGRQLGEFILVAEHERIVARLIEAQDE